MDRRTLGNSELQVSVLCFGGNVFGWTVDEATSFELLDRFVAEGGNFIDTADIYSRWMPGNEGGESETIIGRWLKRSRKRDEVIIATKFGMEFSPDRKGLSKKYMRQCIEGSLRRLQTDYVDLYQSHKDDPDTPIQETLEGYADLIKEGKVRYIGASNYTAERLSESLAIGQEYKLPRYESLQPLYNLYDRSDYETNLEALCRKENIGVIPYYSLASGFLTGKYKSVEDTADTARGQRVKQYLNERGFRIIAALEQVARGHGTTPGAVAIAWLIAREGITAPIASATSVKQLQTLLDATRLKLDRAAIDILDAASEYPVEAQHAR